MDSISKPAKEEITQQSIAKKERVAKNRSMVESEWAREASLNESLVLVSKQIFD